MSKIKLLPDHIISKIAAGEVIEKPLFAIKELIENSIDAKADNISIFLEDAGLKKIIITDNGEGMNKEDILECFKSHTTSKLNTDDLLSIRTLGFRGEALASIAAVSKLIIKSKPKKDLAGTQVDIFQGEVINVSPVGIPIGTTIEVSNLFANVPTRRKFINDNKKEFRQILDLIIRVSLAYPNIKFLLKHNKKIILDLPKTNDVNDRVNNLLGEKVAQNLLPINFEDFYLKVTGFFGTPKISSSKPSKQFIFINGRSIEDKIISLAVKDAYGNVLEEGRHPTFILFITLPFETIDINVHPRKETIKFLDEKLIYELISKSVKQHLEEHNITFTNISFKDSNFGPTLTNSAIGKSLKKDSLTNELVSLGKEIDLSKFIQFHNLYLIFQSKDGLVIIDQHAAHERILYEHLKKEFTQLKNSTNSLKLKTSLQIPLSKMQKQTLHDSLNIFTQLGFSLKVLPNENLEISHIPYLLKDINIEKFIYESLEKLEQGDLLNIDEQNDLMLKYLACRAAVKAGDKLEDIQIKNLLENFQTTPNNSTCPHGRTTIYEFKLDKLNKLFNRN